MLSAAQHSLRLFKVAMTLARHDALFPLELIGTLPAPVRLVRVIAKLRPPRRTAGEPERAGVRLARALTELGPTFIKLGQALATRPDLVGEAVAIDLADLQDRLPPFPGAEARQIIANELGQPVETLFASFDDQAIAAASIAQVHFAVTREGRKVAVKILRPGVERAFERDLESFRWLARTVERTQPALRRLRPTEVVETLARTVALEMDLRSEAAAASELHENTAHNPYFLVPAVVWQFTAQRVLTLERAEGTPMSDRPALLATGLDLKALAAHLVQAFLEQALFDGFFHADLHQGNLFATDEGRIIAVDFGIMGRLDATTRRTFAEILYGFLKRDYAAVADAHFRAGYVPANQSRAHFAQALRAIGEPIADRPARDISLGGLLTQLLKTTEIFAMQTQPQLLLLQKTMVMVEGVAGNLDADINMWEASRPVIERWIKENLGPKARVTETLTRALHAAERLPAVLEDAANLLASARRDGLQLSPDTVAAFTGGRNGMPWWLSPLLGAIAGAAVAAIVLLLET